jgi:hypothetical protein
MRVAVSMVPSLVTEYVSKVTGQDVIVVPRFYERLRLAASVGDGYARKGRRVGRCVIYVPKGIGVEICRGLCRVVE